MKLVTAKFILWLLLPEQKEHCGAFAYDLIQTTIKEPDEMVTALKATEVSLSHVPCFLYLLSSSINVSIFHNTWLNTFQTDLILYIVFSTFIFIL